ncbi:MAG: hypothetical protein Terrestrivirus1_290 [Terrestrivirus sp.]|uniref:Uncharacterized protein n=1 Tax=Terrestrivirus sp. TaxID=2487775 RepID=A0A3G4ZKP7_9VIRU|nr:MAG: hypothetical protein Terrestrivirus1_290 [Terrestrivirus sp.]
MEIPNYVQITNKQKISNPYHKGTINKFYGDFYDFEFDHQMENFEAISIKLMLVGIKFDKVFSSTIEREFKNTIQYGITFLVTTINPNIFWYKYESKAKGSGYNHMLIKGKKIKVTEFIKLDKDDILKLIS